MVPVEAAAPATPITVVAPVVFDETRTVMRLFCVVVATRTLPPITAPVEPEIRTAVEPWIYESMIVALEDWLIERGYLHYENGNRMFYTWPLETSANTFAADFNTKDIRRRAICECVAKMQQAE